MICRPLWDNGERFSMSLYVSTKAKMPVWLSEGSPSHSDAEMDGVRIRRDNEQENDSDQFQLVWRLEDLVYSWDGVSYPS